MKNILYDQSLITHIYTNKIILLLDYLLRKPSVGSCIFYRNCFTVILRDWAFFMNYQLNMKCGIQKKLSRIDSNPHLRYLSNYVGCRKKKM